MLARCLGLAANFANNSSRVLSLQLLGTTTHWDPPAPRFGGSGAGSGSLPFPSQPNAAARGSVRVSWGICWQLAAFITHGDAICGEGTEPGREARACSVLQRRGDGGGAAPNPVGLGSDWGGGNWVSPSRLESSGAIFHLRLPSEPSCPPSPVPKMFGLGGGNDGESALRLRGPRRCGGTASSAAWLPSRFSLRSSTKYFLQKRQNCCRNTAETNGPRQAGKNPRRLFPSRRTLELGSLCPNRRRNKC